MEYPTEHIQQALSVEDPEAVDTFCDFVKIIKGMDTSEASVRKAFGQFLGRLARLHK